MQFWFLTILTLVFVGCSQKRPTPANDSKSFAVVQEIIAEQLKVEVNRIMPESTFSSIGADELDIVEIVMATEEKLGVSISDESLGMAPGASKTDKLADHLTVGALAIAAATAPKGPPPSSKLNEPDDGSLHVHQVGPYAKLSKLPNPRGHELIFIPDFAELLAMSQHKLNRKLTDPEAADLKANAVVMAISAGEAAKLRENRIRRERSQSQ